MPVRPSAGHGILLWDQPPQTTWSELGDATFDGPNGEYAQLQYETIQLNYGQTFHVNEAVNRTEFFASLRRHLNQAVQACLQEAQGIAERAAPQGRRQREMAEAQVIRPATAEDAEVALSADPLWVEGSVEPEAPTSDDLPDLI
jgi:hypothetical protein